MTRKRVVVTDAGSLLQPGIDWLRRQGVEVEVLQGGDQAAKVAAARTADVVLVGVEPFTADDMEQIAGGGRVPGLVIRCGVGYDVVDVKAAERHGIQVANVPDYCTDEVADHTMALLLTAARRLPYFLSAWQEQGRWDWGGGGQPVPRLADLTLGIVGFGRIGSAVARRAAGFGMRVLSTDPAPRVPTETVPLTDLLDQSDAVTLHCPYNPSTHHLMDDDAFRRVKPGALLVNTSRGPIVDTAALVRGLERGQPALAALDVVEGEPAPDLSAPVFKHPQVLLTPHIAYYSEASLRNLSLFAAHNAHSYLHGAPAKNVVNSPA